MSMNKEIDIFSDIIRVPKEEFWEKIQYNETQKSQQTLIGNSPLKKETHSNSSEDEEIKIVKEVPAIPSDLIIQGEEIEIEVQLRIYSQNPITNLPLDVDKPLHANLSSKVFQFRKGHNLHSLFAIWGQIDQYCMQNQQLG